MVQSDQSLNKQKVMKQGFWFVAIGAAFWGINPIFRMLLLDTFTSAQIVLLEHVLLLVIAVPLLWANRADLKSVKFKHLGAIIFIAWGGSALATILFTLGLTYGEINVVLLLQQLQPLFAIFLARIILKEALPRHFSTAVIIALMGTYLLTFGFHFPFGSMGDFFQAASLLSIAAAALWGGSTVMGRYLLNDMKYETVTALRFIVALPLLIMIVAFQGAAWSLPATTGASAIIFINLAASALIPGLLSILIYYRGLANTKASLATIAELSFPTVALIINWLVFNEVVSVAQFIGFLLIWSTMYFLSIQKQPTPTQRIPEPLTSP
ncbi:multidrug transporter [Alkalihalobacillus alcalophilus ATCC 27647 = CGMCC 1.3604]|uniref:Multidrug transporter n=2 Tax=Alkalihalobacillus alcalophilus ATCC 27647 = CGMCC 1.3604 TaxID=1218173 RepID=A0A094WH18_ALKAL|nr:DMT family transporter [Alkalihalobacillus alcalophilus]KGA97074.1 multidrug transporter [Alkalihalobacillus alcalophilus ATCC 27647 = CGMCC 1.3604]MED1563042.1 DMT family transporter [Alkalihalobacillus alcalophilus]THG88795.1 multidrug transporter [Alkalihalobacillus alcalophilus ATCC 27647 = CGMCC 1.3604]